MLPTRIFLDLDDVLNEFTMQALAHVGCLVDPTSFDDFKPGWGFDIIKAANALHPTRVFTPASFWKCFSRKDWRDLPKSTEFEFLLQQSEALVGKENICILTTPILDPDCAAGKVEWIYNHCPKWLHRQYLIGPPKHFCARPDALLIDDSDANIKAFRAHGGQAILVARPWNSCHGFNAMVSLKKAFRSLFFQKWRQHETWHGTEEDMVM